MFSSSALDVQFIKFKTKRKGKRNPQTSYWTRASQTTQSQGCLFAFFSTLAFKKCLVPYCSFGVAAVNDSELTRNNQKLQPCTVCFQFFGRLIQLLRNAFTDYSFCLFSAWYLAQLSNLELLVRLGSRKCKLWTRRDARKKFWCLVLSDFCMKIFARFIVLSNLKLVVRLGSRKCKLWTRRDARKKFWCVVLSDFWMKIFARFIVLLTAGKQDEIEKLPSQKYQCYKEILHVQCATIELWMHLGGLLSFFLA